MGGCEWGGGGWRGGRAEVRVACKQSRVERHTLTPSDMTSIRVIEYE